MRNVTKQYVYDNYGNILSKKTYTYNTTDLIKEDTYEYSDSNWQDLLTKFNNETITYDEIGNPLTIGNKTFTWMNGRELSTYSDGTNNISYKYNLDGIRTSKTVNGIKTDYILEDSSIIFEDRNGTMLYYIYNGSELLGFVYNNNTYYYHKNMFGDIIGILDSNYNEIVSYEYDNWGALVNITDNSNINLGTINPFRYRSYYYDTETGLYYLNSRYYNPEIGRFINADYNLGSEETIISYNNFQYSFNNPINLLDDDGEWPQWAKNVVKATAAVAVVATVAVASVATGCAVGPIAGAFVGGVISGVVSASTQLATTGKVNLDTLAMDAVAGAISGAISATPIGLTTSVIANTAIGVGAYAGTQILNDETIDPVGVAINGIGGAISGYISGSGTNANEAIKSYKLSAKKLARESRRPNRKYANKVIARETKTKKAIAKVGLKSVIRTVAGAISNWFYKRKAGY